MLAEFFTSKTRARLLKIFFNNPGRSYYQSELKGDDAVSVIQYELSKLVSLNIIETFTVRNKRYYQVNIKHKAYQEIRNLVQKVS